MRRHSSSDFRTLSFMFHLGAACVPVAAELETGLESGVLAEDVGAGVCAAESRALAGSPATTSAASRVSVASQPAMRMAAMPRQARERVLMLFMIRPPRLVTNLQVSI